MNHVFWRYLGIYTGVFLLISLFEIFFLSPLVDFFGNGFWIRFLVYTVLFLLVNPFLTAFLTDKIGTLRKNEAEHDESE